MQMKPTKLGLAFASARKERELQMAEVLLSGRLMPHRMLCDPRRRENQLHFHSELIFSHPEGKKKNYQLYSFSTFSLRYLHSANQPITS